MGPTIAGVSPDYSAPMTVQEAPAVPGTIPTVSDRREGKKNPLYEKILSDGMKDAKNPYEQGEDRVLGQAADWLAENGGYAAFSRMPEAMKSAVGNTINAATRLPGMVDAKIFEMYGGRGGKAPGPPKPKGAFWNAFGAANNLGQGLIDMKDKAPEEGVDAISAAAPPTGGSEEPMVPTAVASTGPQPPINSGMPAKDTGGGESTEEEDIAPPTLDLSKYLKSDMDQSLLSKILDVLAAGAKGYAHQPYETRMQKQFAQKLEIEKNLAGLQAQFNMEIQKMPYQKQLEWRNAVKEKNMDLANEILLRTNEKAIQAAERIARASSLASTLYSEGRGVPALKAKQVFEQ